MNRILVVDDEEGVLNAVKRIFKKDDYKMEFAQDGEKALQIAMSFDPDIVILDIMMPGIDGYEVCRRLKSGRKTSEVMVLLLSAKSDLKDKLAGYEALADDYLTKPYEPEELRARIKILLRLKNTLDERNRLIGELKDTLTKVKVLSGLLPICANCKKIRDDQGYWNQIETYIRDHSEANFSHSICSDCANELYPELKINDERN
jgi:DNA-binding response OmpR family regulator